MGSTLEAVAARLTYGTDAWKAPVRAVATANQALTGLVVVDGVTLQEGDRVLCAAQSNAAHNGIYVASSGPWKRSDDFREDKHARLGTTVKVLEGTTGAGTEWLLTSPTIGSIKVNVTNLTFSQESPAAMQGPAINIGTEGSNTNINVGNGADDVLINAENLDLFAGTLIRIGQGGAGETLNITYGTDAVNVANLGTLRLDVAPALVIRENGQSAASFTFTPDFLGASPYGGPSIVIDQGRPFTLTQTQRTSGAGVAMTIRGQQGQAGQVGGDLIISPGLGGTPGTNLPGNARVKVGTPAGGATGKLIVEREDGTNLLNFYELSAGIVGLYFGTVGGSAQGIVRGSTLGLESSAGLVAVQPATDLYLGHASNRDIFYRESGTLVLTKHLDADGATYLRFSDGPTEVAIEQVQRATSGVGRPMRIQAQRGNGGKGGDLTLASGAPGTATTHEGGDIILQLHDPIASSSGRFSIMGNATEWLGIERNPASGGILMQCLSYSLSVYSASTMRLQSSGQTQVVGTSVVKGITGGNSTYEELQDANGRVFKRTYVGTAGPITSATTTYALTVATTNDRVYKLKAEIVASNDTDNDGATYEMELAVKNVAGTITSIGGSATIVKAREDTNQAGWSPVLAFSGTNILVGLTTDSTDTVHFNAILEVCERVLV